MNVTQWDEIKKDIELWINDFLSRPNVYFNNLPPCPFAQKALLENKILWNFNLNPYPEVTKNLINECASKLLTEDKDIALVIHSEYSSWSPENVTDYVEKWRVENRARGLFLLRDHPLKEEYLGHLKMNQGKYLIFFIQKKDKLIKSRIKLQRNGFYNNLATEELNMFFPIQNEQTHDI